MREMKKEIDELRKENSSRETIDMVNKHEIQVLKNQLEQMTSKVGCIYKNTHFLFTLFKFFFIHILAFFNGCFITKTTII